MLDRIAALVGGRSNGVWSTQIDVEYKRRYNGQCLPKDWAKTVMERHDGAKLRVDSPVEGRFIVTPNNSSAASKSETTNENNNVVSSKTSAAAKTMTTLNSDSANPAARNSNVQQQTKRQGEIISTSQAAVRNSSPPVSFSSVNLLLA